MYKFEAIDKKNYQEMFERYNSLQTQTKPTPMENMNQIFDKTEYQKKKKRSWIFIILFSNKRVCKLFTRHSRQ